jgi:hypothetical protein
MESFEDAHVENSYATGKVSRWSSGKSIWQDQEIYLIVHTLHAEIEKRLRKNEFEIT